MRLSASVALVCCFWLALPGTARADPITVNGGWQLFSWDNAPGTFNNGGPLTFSAAQLTRLTVTDAFLDGDRFQVFDNKVSLGFIEGFNNKIRSLQKRAYGYHDEDYFRLKILTCMLPKL